METIELLATNNQAGASYVSARSHVGLKSFLHFGFLVVLAHLLISLMDISVPVQHSGPWTFPHSIFVIDKNVCFSIWMKVHVFSIKQNTFIQSQPFTPRTLYVIHYEHLMVNRVFAPHSFSNENKLEIILETTTETLLFKIGIAKCRPKLYGKLILVVLWWYQICVHRRSSSRGHVNVILSV